MDTVSSKSCDQGQLLTERQHLKKVLTVDVSSPEINTYTSVRPLTSLGPNLLLHFH